MHKIGGTGKWQVVKGEIWLALGVLADICFAKMSGRFNDPKCLRICSAGVGGRWRPFLE